MGQQVEYNISLEDDENEDYGGAPPLPQVPRGMLAILLTPDNRGVPPPSSESGNSSPPPEKQETLPESLADDDIYVPDTVRVPRCHRHRMVIQLPPPFDYQGSDVPTERSEEVPSESSYDMLIPQRQVLASTPRQPQFESGPMLTRQLERTRVLATQPDNVYGDRAPADILDEDDNTFFSPGGDQRPGTSGSHAKNLGILFDMSQTEITAKIAWERGAKLINFLLNKAAIKPSSQASGELPNVCNVCEWHYRDLMCFPEATQKEWKTAMLEELELLQKQNVFELTNLPKGHKSIGCR